MRQPKNQFYTRRQLIEDCVLAYIRNNPKEYENFKKLVQQKRASLADKEFGRLKEEKHSFEGNFRLAVSIPKKLYDAMEILLEAHKEERFGDVKGEMKWFTTNYPQFLIPNKY